MNNWNTKFCRKSAKKIAKIANDIPDWQAETSVHAGLRDAKGHTVWAMRNFCSFRLPLLVLLGVMIAVSMTMIVMCVCRRRRHRRDGAVYCECAAVGEDE